MKLRDMKKHGYDTVMYGIIAERYGVESSIFHPNRINGIGLEDITNELEANDAQIDGQDQATAPTDDVYADPTGMGEDMPEDSYADGGYPADGGYGAEPAAPEDEYRKMSSDGELGTDGNGDYTVDTTEPAGSDWQDTNYDDLKSDADCINLTKVLGEYINNYALNFEEFVKTNKDFIEYTGDFKQSEYFNTFINPSMELLRKVYDGDPIIKQLDNLLEVMSRKREMVAICGKPDNPFIYEGMQIVIVDAIRNILACVPYSLKNNQTLAEVIDSMQLNVVKCLIQMVADLVEVSPMFGNKIYYVEPVVSEITGKSEEIASTPYARLEVMTRGNESFSRMRLANESIMNLIEIKNNKALVEYTALNKMMLVITYLNKDTDLKSSTSSVLSTVLKLASANGEDVITLIDQAIETFRENIFIPEIKAMAELSAKESEKIAKDPESQPKELSSANKEISDSFNAGKEKVVEVEVEESNFDDDLE